MITPFVPVGIGQQQAIKVFKVTFSTALSDIPRLTAYDDYIVSTTVNTIFTGTTYISYPMIAGVGGIQPDSTAWFPTTPTLGDTTVGVPNMLKGSVYGVDLTTTSPGAGDSVYFNIGYKIPYDVTTLASMSHIVLIEYQYTGSAPSVAFYGNKSPGTESSPNWVSLDSLASGTAPSSGNVTQIRPCDSGKGSIGGGGDGSFRLSIPQVNYTFPGEIWMIDY